MRELSVTEPSHGADICDECDAHMNTMLHVRRVLCVFPGDRVVICD